MEKSLIGRRFVTRYSKTIYSIEKSATPKYVKITWIGYTNKLDVVLKEYAIHSIINVMTNLDNKDWILITPKKVKLWKHNKY